MPHECSYNSSEKWKVRRHKTLDGFGDAGVIACCMKLQVQQQADVNYLFLCVGVFMWRVFTLASPHLHAILAAHLIKTLYLRRCCATFLGCVWISSRSLAQADPVFCN